MWYKPPLRASAAPDLAKNATLIPHPAAALRRYRDCEIGAPGTIRTSDPQIRSLNFPSFTWLVATLHRFTNSMFSIT